MITPKRAQRIKCVILVAMRLLNTRWHVKGDTIADSPRKKGASVLRGEKPVRPLGGLLEGT